MQVLLRVHPLCNASFAGALSEVGRSQMLLRRDGVSVGAPPVHS